MTAEEIDTSAGYQEGAIAPEPAKEEPKAPEPSAPEDPKPKGDPLTALVQERAANRDNSAAMQSEIAALRNEIASLKTPAAPAEPAEFKNPYDPTEQPVDYLKAELEYIKSDVASAKQSVGQDVQQQQQQQQLNDFERNIHTELQAASAKQPLVADAHNFVLDGYTRMAKAQGYTGADAASRARNAMLQGHLMAAQRGDDAVTAVARMAQEMGFQVQQKPDPKTRGKQAASQSLGGATGDGGSDGPPTLDALRGMSRKQLKANDGAYLKQIKAALRGEA